MRWAAASGEGEGDVGGTGDDDAAPAAAALAPNEARFAAADEEEIGVALAEDDAPRGEEEGGARGEDDNDATRAAADARVAGLVPGRTPALDAATEEETPAPEGRAVEARIPSSRSRNTVVIRYEVFNGFVRSLAARTALRSRVWENRPSYGPRYRAVV
jgi:hypothetical protein